MEDAASIVEQAETDRSVSFNVDPLAFYQDVRVFFISNFLAEVH